MRDRPVDVVATTISGSIADWSKVEHIVPLFRERGWDAVTLHVVHTHAAARDLTARLLMSGGRTVIAAGGSGTFNSVLEGAIDSAVPLEEITLGFLRKGSADLLGKVLGMPDRIGPAVDVLAEALARERTVPCDVIGVGTPGYPHRKRHLVGYAGAEIFGLIPHYTENRLIKYYKGILGQLFGDLGPFFVGASLAVLEKSWRDFRHASPRWEVWVDGVLRTVDAYQALIIVSGDLGPDLPFARSVALGSGDFHLFALRDRGLIQLPRQFRGAWTAAMLDQPGRFGLEHYRVAHDLRLRPRSDAPFRVNVDGSTMRCTSWVEFSIVGQAHVLNAA